MWPSICAVKEHSDLSMQEENKVHGQDAFQASSNC